MIGMIEETRECLYADKSVVKDKQDNKPHFTNCNDLLEPIPLMFSCIS